VAGVRSWSAAGFSAELEIWKLIADQDLVLEPIVGATTGVEAK
jgi:hypothetical protein